MKKNFFSCVIILFGLLCCYSLVDLKNVSAAQVNSNGKVFWRDVTNSGNNPSVEVGSNSFGRAVALDRNNYPHICATYSNGIGGYFLEHVFWDGTEWQTSQIDSSTTNSDFGKYCSIAINKNNGDVHVSYYNGTALKYYGDYTIAGIYKLVIDNSVANVGQYTSIAVDTNGNAHISYYDVTNTNCKHAWGYGTNWQTETIYNSGDDVGQYSSIAVDANNNIHVSMYDATATDLRYREKLSNGSFNGQIVDTNAGAWSSIAVGSDGLARISYYDASAAHLKMATGSGTSFSTETANSNAGNGFFTSIALDPSNFAHISSFYLLGALNFAFKDANGWTNQTIDNQGSVGWYSSLAHGNNNDYISYYDATTKRQDFVLIDSLSPIATAEVAGRVGNAIGWNLSSSDYSEMGGAKYYCVDQNNTCLPLNGTALISATATGSFSVDSSSDSSIYLRIGDWAGNITSFKLTAEIKKTNVSPNITPQNTNRVVNYDLSYMWNNLPVNSQNYYIRTARYNSYAPKFAFGSHSLIKRYWKLMTNLNTYHKKARKNLIIAENNFTSCKNNINCSSSTLDKAKKQVQKYQKKNFKIRIRFNYSYKLVTGLRSRNSVLQKITPQQVEQKMWLKMYNKKNGRWINVSPLKLIANPVQNLNKHTFTANFWYFQNPNTLFTIGLK